MKNTPEIHEFDMWKTVLDIIYKIGVATFKIWSKPVKLCLNWFGTCLELV